ncbi:hypothetical protein ACU5DF_00735 [Aliivibrio wodanis]|uniref:hypothetical protein n=1 Tax=Aliivibrio wodanis TaxID=80852 RepID=UPI00406C0A84
MKKILLSLSVLLFSANLSAAPMIEKNRVVCDNQKSMKVFLNRKDNGKAKLPSDCKKLDYKRKGKVIKTFPNKGFVKFETKAGQTFYTPTSAVKR